MSNVHIHLTELKKKHHLFFSFFNANALSTFHTHVFSKPITKVMNVKVFIISKQQDLDTEVGIQVHENLGAW